jgi:hypothetical protein
MKKVISIIIIAPCLFFSGCQSNSHTDAPIVNDSQATVDTRDSTKFSGALFYGSWVQPNPINKKEMQGFKLNKDSTAESINMATLLYKHWWFDDNKLYLVSESKGNRQSVIDTFAYNVLQATEQELHLRDRQQTITYKRLQK